MGVKRPVDTSFWTDGKVDEFSPEDKYFMLYLLTNPFSKQLGIYEISIKQAAFQMGYSVDAFRVLLDRFENKYKMILFSKETNEVAILNFLRHAVMKGGKPVEDCIRQDMANVKNKQLIDIVFSRLYGRDDLNATVRKIVESYVLANVLFGGNDNDNDNDNDRTHSVSCDESSHESSTAQPNDEIKQKEHKVTKADIDAFFESIWELYPVKKGKGQVSDTQRKKLFKIGFEQMEKAITRYLDGLKKDASWRKPQNGSTFFNSGYIDYLDANFVPDGNKPGGRKEIVPGWMSGKRELDEDEKLAIQRILSEDEPSTVGNNPELAERAEQLKQKLQGDH